MTSFVTRVLQSREINVDALLDEFTTYRREYDFQSALKQIRSNSLRLNEACSRIHGPLQNGRFVAEL